MKKYLSYKLEVYGHLWQGCRAVYSYSPDHKIETDAEAEREAGDFASLIDWRLLEVTHEDHHTKREDVIIRRVKTLRGFRNGMTPARFYRLAGG